MANITITVQSLLKAALYDSYTVADTTTVSAFKTTIQGSTSFDPTWYQLVFGNVAITDESKTLAYYNIVNGSSLRTANKIGHLSSLELRQKAKLNLAALTRQYDGNPRDVYDITELPTQYSGNTIVDNPNTGGLVVGRPWTT